MSDRFDALLMAFEFMEDWEDRYRAIIDLGNKLPPMAEEDKIEENRVHGCASQVWFKSRPDENDATRLIFDADSDAHIVRGLVAILLMLYTGKTSEEILSIDAKGRLGELGLDGHLTSQRSNGLYSMVLAIQELARRAA